MTITPRTYAAMLLRRALAVLPYWLGTISLAVADAIDGRQGR